MRLSGGGAKSPFWHQLFADIFNLPVTTLKTQEGSAYGAALLAMVGTGAYHSAKELCAAAIEETSRKQPESAAGAYYERAYRIYGSLYPALRQAFQDIGALQV